MSDSWWPHELQHSRLPSPPPPPGVCSDSCPSRASLVAQRVKRLPAMWETWILSLGWEDPLEKEMATHSSTLAWKIPWMEKPGRYSPWGHKESDTTEQLHFHFRVHRVGDAIQPFHPRSYPSPLAFSLSQHQDHDAQRYCIIFVDPITLHFRSPFLYTLIPCLRYVRYVSGVSFFLELFLCSSLVA